MADKAKLRLEKEPGQGKGHGLTEIRDLTCCQASTQTPGEWGMNSTQWRLDIHWHKVHFLALSSANPRC